MEDNKDEDEVPDLYHSSSPSSPSSPLPPDQPPTIRELQHDGINLLCEKRDMVGFLKHGFQFLGHDYARKVQVYIQAAEEEEEQEEEAVLW